MVKLISFDIDGTLEMGDPPGIITMDMVRAIKALGYLIGSGSDRPLSSQRQLWESHHIVVDFTTLKHQLADVKARFQAEVYYTSAISTWTFLRLQSRLSLREGRCRPAPGLGPRYSHSCLRPDWLV